MASTTVAAAHVVVGLGRDGAGGLRVPHHKVCVRAFSYHTLWERLLGNSPVCHLTPPTFRG